MLMVVSVLNRIIIPYSRNNNRRGPWNFSCPGTVLCLHQTWHRLQITWFLVPVCETVIRRSAILSDLHQSFFFSYNCDYTWPSITSSMENLCLKPSDEYTFQHFIPSVKTNSSLKFVGCFHVAFVLFSETRLIHNPIWSVESVFMCTGDSITTTDMCKVTVMSAHTYVNS